MNTNDIIQHAHTLRLAALMNPVIAAALEKCYTYYQWQECGDDRAYQLCMFPLPYFKTVKGYRDYLRLSEALFSERPIYDFGDDETMAYRRDSYNTQWLEVESRKLCVLNVDELNALILQLRLNGVPSYLLDLVVRMAARQLYIQRMN